MRHCRPTSTGGTQGCQGFLFDLWSIFWCGSRGKTNNNLSVWEYITHLSHFCTVTRNKNCFCIGWLRLWTCVQWFAGMKVKLQAFHTQCVCLLSLSMAVGFALSGAEAELHCSLVIVQNRTYLQILERSRFILPKKGLLDFLFLRLLR